MLLAARAPASHQGSTVGANRGHHRGVPVVFHHSIRKFVFAALIHHFLGCVDASADIQLPDGNVNIWEFGTVNGCDVSTDVSRAKL